MSPPPHRLPSAPLHGPRKASPDRHEGDHVERRWKQPHRRLERVVRCGLLLSEEKVTPRRLQHQLELTLPLRAWSCKKARTVFGLLLCWRQFAPLPTLLRSYSPSGNGHWTISGLTLVTRGLFAEVWCRATLSVGSTCYGNISRELIPNIWADAVGDRLCGPARQLWHPSCACATQSPESGKCALWARA
jgi:hypothetical protein